MAEILAWIGPAQSRPVPTGWTDIALERLAAFLDDLEARPFRFGRCDCLLALADWLVWQGRPDPAAHLRRRYRSHNGWKRIVADAGGAERLVGHLARRAGLKRRRGAASAGDVALVRIPARGLFGAIACADGRFAVKTRDGLVTARFRQRAAWGP